MVAWTFPCNHIAISSPLEIYTQKVIVKSFFT